MSEAQILELVGLFLGLMGIGFITSRGRYLRIVDDVKRNSAILLTFGGANLVIGYLIVTNFNTWVWDWEVLVTVIGWIALLKGVVILAVPSTHLKIADRAVEALGKHVKLLGVILLVLGVALIYVARFLI